jgi:hypothetical protein
MEKVVKCFHLLQRWLHQWAISITLTAQYEHFTCVKVPVLSEKIYSIWPSSSLRVVVRALAEVLLFS